MQFSNQGGYMKKSILLLSIMLVPIMIWAQGFLRKDSIDFNENSKNEPKRSAKGENRAHGFLDKLMNEKITVLETIVRSEVCNACHFCLES